VLAGKCAGCGSKTHRTHHITWNTAEQLKRCPTCCYS
jgi:hypothetical protein